MEERVQNQWMEKSSEEYIEEYCSNLKLVYKDYDNNKFYHNITAV